MSEPNELTPRECLPLKFEAYTVIGKVDEDNDVVVRLSEFPGCMAHGETWAQAIERLRDVFSLFIEDWATSAKPLTFKFAMSRFTTLTGRKK